MAPVDCRPQRPLPLGRVARTAGEQLRAGARAGRASLGGEHLDPRGGQLDREREAVEAAADLGDGLGSLEAGCHLSRAGSEQRDRLLLGKRRHRVLVLGADVERLAARDEDRHLLRLCEQLGQPRCRLDELLEVVEDEQRPLAAQVLGEPVLGAQRAGSPSLTLSNCAIVDSTSAGSRSAASGTHQTPSG